MSFGEVYGDNSSQHRIDELEILRGNASCLRSEILNLRSEHHDYAIIMRNLLARLRTTNCCLSCQLRLVERREALERIILALEKKLNLLEGNLYTIQEKITFLEDYIPRLIEHEREMLAQEIARLRLEYEEYYMCRPFTRN
jgi:hypothetical protein